MPDDAAANLIRHRAKVAATAHLVHCTLWPAATERFTAQVLDRSDDTHDSDRSGRPVGNHAAAEFDGSCVIDGAEQSGHFILDAAVADGTLVGVATPADDA